ncbi:MAG: hypothetical protein ABSG95_07860 [Solirubrobacteraceae bacterium]
MAALALALAANALASTSISAVVVPEANLLGIGFVTAGSAPTFDEGA